MARILIARGVAECYVTLPVLAMSAIDPLLHE